MHSLCLAMIDNILLHFLYQFRRRTQIKFIIFFRQYASHVMVGILKSVHSVFYVPKTSEILHSVWLWICSDDSEECVASTFIVKAIGVGECW